MQRKWCSSSALHRRALCSPGLTLVTPVPAAPRFKLKPQQIPRPGAAVAELHLLNLQLCVWL